VLVDRRQILKTAASAVPALGQSYFGGVVSALGGDAALVTTAAPVASPVTVALSQVVSKGFPALGWTASYLQHFCSDKASNNISPTKKLRGVVSHFKRLQELEPDVLRMLETLSNVSEHPALSAELEVEYKRLPEQLFKKIASELFRFRMKSESGQQEPVAYEKDPVVGTALEVDSYAKEFSSRLRGCLSLVDTARATLNVFLPKAELIAEGQSGLAVSKADQLLQAWCQSLSEGKLTAVLNCPTFKMLSEYLGIISGDLGTFNLKNYRSLRRSLNEAGIDTQELDHLTLYKRAKPSGQFQELEDLCDFADSVSAEDRSQSLVNRLELHREMEYQLLQILKQPKVPDLALPILDRAAKAILKMHSYNLGMYAGDLEDLELDYKATLQRLKKMRQVRVVEGGFNKKMEMLALEQVMTFLAQKTN
jgi:hypothetical protein